MAARKGRGLPKRLPTTSFYDVKVADDAEIEAATADLSRAEVAAKRALLLNDAPGAEAAEVALVAARARVAACRERLVFTEISPVDVDKILTDHPFPESTEGFAADWQWPFIHHLAAASVVDIDQSPDEWAAWTAGWSAANWIQFREAVNAAQTKTATAGLPKG